MKRYFALLLCLIVVASCKSQQQKAAATIKAHLSKTLHDFSSYESVEVSKLDSVFYGISEDPRFAEAMDSMRANDDRYFSIGRRIHKLETSLKFRDGSDTTGKRDSIALLRQQEPQAGEIARSFGKQLSARYHAAPKKLKGFAVTHAYRAKNERGALQLYKKVFLLNENLDEVMSVDDPGSSKLN